MTYSAYLLVTHGSRNFNYQTRLQQLAIVVQQQISQKKTTDLSPQEKKIISSPLVKTACLELADIPLSESILNFAKDALSKKYQSVKIIPLFLLSGVHVRKDIPAQISIAQKKLANLISLELMPHLGSYDHLLVILAQQFSQFNAQKQILLAHGSNLENGNQECEEIAHKLKVDLAYWSISPNLTQKVAYLVSLGVKTLAIVPYFLFEGKITQAIASQIEQLTTEYPEIKLYLGSPLGSSLDLANLIVENLNGTIDCRL
jgi:sirohydrochlorin ferrochelatase